jgi:hypothetical protein
LYFVFWFSSSSFSWYLFWFLVSSVVDITKAYLYVLWSGSPTHLILIYYTQTKAWMQRSPHQTSHHTIIQIILSISNNKDLMMATTGRNM